MSLKDDLIQAMQDMGEWPVPESVATAVMETLDGHAWHPPSECVHDECRDESEVARLGAAIRSLHTQAHNGPQDSLEVENCHTEPCKSVSL